MSVADKFRITNNARYMTLSKHEQLCYRSGLPIRFMNHMIEDLVFVDYSVGVNPPKPVTAVKQDKWAKKLKKTMTRHNEDSLIVACFSAPTDTAAFKCAGSFFEAGLRVGMSCGCYSAQQIKSDWSTIPKHDMYVIYGLTDQPQHDIDRAVASFLHARDGVLRILVLAGSPSPISPWEIIRKQLKLRVDILLVLNDEDDRNTGVVEKIG